MAYQAELEARLATADRAAAEAHEAADTTELVATQHVLDAAQAREAATRREQAAAQAHEAAAQAREAAAQATRAAAAVRAELAASREEHLRSAVDTAQHPSGSGSLSDPGSDTGEASQVVPTVAPQPVCPAVVVEAEPPAGQPAAPQPLRLPQAHFCGACGNFSEAVTQCCSGCKRVYYCDTECQRVDWMFHKPDCTCTARASVSARR